VTESAATAKTPEISENPEAPAANDFFQQNLAAIRRWAPYLYSRLAAIEVPNTDLIVDPDGGIDIGFRGQRLYGQDAVAHASARIEQFVKVPTREFINEPDPAKMMGMTGDFCAALRDRMKDAGIACDPAKTFSNSHFLLVFGIGLGLHLQTLIERTEAKVAILIEPNIEYLYHSLFVTDWATLFEFGDRRGVRFSLIVGQKPAEIAAKAGQVLRSNNPSLLDGVSLFTDYSSVILDRAKDLIRRDLFLSVSGLGFFDDERIMCRNTVGNLAAGEAEILGEYLSTRGEPLFVIGSGPSVESDLDFIAAHAGQAILMSIGTGLRSLLVHGIRPDFHIELENDLGTAEMVAAIAEEFGIGGVTLVASVTVHPDLARIFDRTIFFFRERVTPTQIFGGLFSILQPAGPTVANSALVSSIRLGFRTIYLFGVDMGSKSDGRFHARGSVYDTGFLDEYVEVSQSFPGNLGGSAVGSHVFDWSRKVLENTMHHYRSVQVYNCSDGVRIDGAIPKVSRAIQLPEAVIDRIAVEREISRGLTRCERDLWSKQWRESDIRAQSAAILDHMEEVLAALAADRETSVDWLQGFCDALQAMELQSPANAALLGGTLQLAVGCASWYDRRISDPSQTGLYRRIAAAELSALVKRLRQGLEALLDEMEATLDRRDAHDQAASG
jgi:flagellin glycosyltransferase Maf-like protein/6-hydroxymethylpterin diphosphokinase MptE-like protein